MDEEHVNHIIKLLEDRIINIEHFNTDERLSSLEVFKDDNPKLIEKQEGRFTILENFKS